MRQTKADLLRELRNLEPYQFAFFTLRRGVRPVRLRDDNHDPARRRTVEILDPGSPTGGVVLEGTSCRWAGDWCSAAVQSQDVWACDMAHQVHQLQREAWDAKRGGPDEAALDRLGNSLIRAGAYAGDPRGGDQAGE